ncbi:MAG: signal peptidase I [Crocinitomicaceae bacterium]|nr:signal peptidase I [Crocinitomicaceae bacterium]|tara:strand:+ start:5644 stop:7236 length:1593 start_codon:yes stop_codon:yes gene_type:complete
MSLIPWILLGIVCLEHLIFIPKLIKRSVGTVWHGYIPGLNALAILKIIGRPWYWALFLLVPGVNLIMLTIMHVELGIVFGKRTTKYQWFFGGLPWIALPQIALNEDLYVGPRDWSRMKKSSIREWGEAILWAIVVASVFRTYSFETFTIPTGSMEGSMLVGDYLIVNKMTYGAKLPETPFAAPLIHNTLPYSMIPSYTSWFSLPHIRLPGYREVKRGDAVVFNFPPGDTIYVDKQLAGHDFYGILRDQAIKYAGNDVKKFSENPDEYLEMAREAGKRSTGLMQRPIDKKENYVKRCIGLPGETLQIKDRQVFIDGTPIKNPDNLQYEYKVSFDSRTKAERAIKSLELTTQDLGTVYNSEGGIELIIALTNAEVEILENSELYSKIEIMSTVNRKRTLQIFPNAYTDEFNEWTLDDFGPVYIPKAGETVELNERNLHIYKRVISVYDKCNLEVKEGVIYIDGEIATSYKFKQDYFWMMGDNRHRSADSRMWGFVPNDHIVGRASFIWFSRQTKEQHGESKIRWDRVFTTVK